LSSGTASGFEGKLPVDLIAAFLAIADSLDREFAEVRQAVVANARFNEVTQNNLFAWGDWYDLPPMLQLFKALGQFGLNQYVLSALKDENPPAALLKLARTELPEEMGASSEQKEQIAKNVGFMPGLYFSIRSVGHYGKWMNELLAARDDESLLRAIAIDPVASTHQAFQDRLARAVFYADTRFLGRYQLALRGPSKKISRQHSRIRLVAKMLLDSGNLPMPAADLVSLFCDQLKLYKPGEDPGKALKKLIKVVTPTPTT
jgi:hypothetical protein